MEGNHYYMRVIIFYLSSHIECKQFFKLRFGGNFKISGELNPQLNRTDLTPQELFSIPDIIGDIKQNI